MGVIKDYFFEVKQKIKQDKVFVLVIYDITDNKRRTKLAKYLQGYGFRVQKSAFEAIIPKRKYQKMLRELPKYISGEDSIKVYKIIGSGQVTSFGKTTETDTDDIVII